MVTKPNLPVPPTSSQMPTMPKIDGPKIATGASQDPKYNAGMAPKMTDPNDSKPDLANKDRGSKFTLPEKVSQADIRDNSFKYGGGRSAGNRSMADNFDRKEDQQ